jgi:hypothetical protein
MPPPHISLAELYQMQNKKKNTKKVVFDRVLELCHRRIRNVSTYGGMNTFYEIPGLVVGYPLFNIHDCADYVIDKLRKTGFIVQVLPPPQVCVIYVSWDPIEIKSNKQLLLTGPSDKQQNNIQSIQNNQSILKNNTNNSVSIPPRLEMSQNNVKKEVKWNFLLDDE